RRARLVRACWFLRQPAVLAAVPAALAGRESLPRLEGTTANRGRDREKRSTFSLAMVGGSSRRPRLSGPALCPSLPNSHGNDQRRNPDPEQGYADRARRSPHTRHGHHGAGRLGQRFERFRQTTEDRPIESGPGDTWE